MNMMLRKPEIYAPSFPDLELDDEFEVKDDQVLFSLEVAGTITPIYVVASSLVQSKPIVLSITTQSIRKMPLILTTNILKWIAIRWPQLQM